MCWAGRKWFYPTVDLAGAGLCVFLQNNLNEKIALPLFFYFFLFFLNTLNCFFSPPIKDEKQILHTASRMAQGCWLQLLKNICHSFSRIFFGQQDKKFIVSLACACKADDSGCVLPRLFFRMET